jgi:hypothetical protein
MTIGYLHIPKTAGMYLTARINLALSLPNCTFHKVIDFEHLSIKGIEELKNLVQDQFLVHGQWRYNDHVLRAYPFYAGHFSKIDLITLNRKFRFTNFVDPWRRAFSLFNYSLNRSITPERDIEEQFEKWLLINFKDSIFRQYYGLGLGERHDFSVTAFNEEFTSFFDSIYLCEPDEVILNLQARDDLPLKTLTSGPKVNEATGINHFKFLESPAERLYEIFSESLQPEIELIEYIRKYSHNGESPLKTMYTISEFELLYNEYRSK